LSSQYIRLDHSWLASSRLGAPANIITAHIELVRELVHTYGANVSLQAEKKGSKNVTSLVLAFSLDSDACRTIVQILLEHGAQLTTPSTNVLNLPMVSTSDIDLFATYSPDKFSRALRECSSSYDTPLTHAIVTGREEIAVQLLTHGALPQVDSDLTTIVGANLPWITTDLPPPLLLAALKEMPLVMKALLERGADPAVTLTEEQAKRFWDYRDCRTALDIVRFKLAELHSWEEEEERLPQHLSNADELLQRKKDAIFSLIGDYEEVEVSLVQAKVPVSEGLDLAISSPSGPEVSRKRPKTFAIQGKYPESQDTPTLISIEKIKSKEEGQAAL
jgi:hypothetical protein